MSLLGVGSKRVVFGVELGRPKASCLTAVLDDAYERNAMDRINLDELPGSSNRIA